ncbi:hypothetical protein Sm713_14640 [Streptomyces sp. TS71-3]|nr:hypothetical protein Sm713_14640 [Streptomyces sp. TS71-3]
MSAPDPGLRRVRGRVRARARVPRRAIRVSGPIHGVPVPVRAYCVPVRAFQAPGTGPRTQLLRVPGDQASPAGAVPVGGARASALRAAHGSGTGARPHGDRSGRTSATMRHPRGVENHAFDLSLCGHVDKTLK